MQNTADVTFPYKNTILLVDDEKTNLLVLSHMLSPEYTIYTARNGAEAIERATKYTPDLILLDIIMPGMDGYETLEALKGSPKTKEISVIFITGLRGIEEEVKGLERGADDYIVKPFVKTIVQLRVRNQIKMVNQMRNIGRRLRQQTLMTKVSQVFLMDTPVDTRFNDTLRMIGEFMGISQIQFFRLEEIRDSAAILECVNEWSNPTLELQTEAGSVRELKDPLYSILNNLIYSDDKYLCSNSGELFKEAMAPYRIRFNSYITTPIFVKGRMSAILDFGREDTERDWSGSELNLAALVAGIFSGVLERESIEHDLSVVLKLKTDLIAAKEAAEKSSRAKSEFISRMSHEIRTPLNAVMGMTKIALSADQEERRRDCLEKIGDASRRLVNIVDDILDFSDMEEKRFTLESGDFDFRAAAGTVLDEAGISAAEKNQILTSFIDPSIPGMLTGDEKRLVQVMANLLSNAVKFTPQGGAIKLTAKSLGIEGETVTVRVEVEDSGIGITKALRETVFAPFEQADGGIAREYNGTGLGLPIARSIVRMMGGEIWAEERQGGGARFIFTFTAGIKAEAEEDAGAEGEGFLGKTAMLVEDVEINREIVTALLEQTGIGIICAQDGREAVELFSAAPGKYDVILMDINMPVMDGVEASKRIRAGSPGGAVVPIIAMTANVDPGSIKSYFDAGMNDHIGKPIDFDELEKKLKTHLLKK